MDRLGFDTDTPWLNPSVLKWAREWCGLSIDDAAARMKRAPEQILAWESGTRVPTVRQARSLVTYYGRSFLELFLPAPPAVAQPMAVPDFRTAAGHQEPSQSFDMREVIRWAEARRANAIDLFRDRGEFPPSLPSGFVATLEDDPDVTAARARELIDFAFSRQRAMSKSDLSSLPIKLREHAERCGILTFRSNELKQVGARGICLAITPLPVIVIGPESPTAQSFTLLHELGHVFLRESGITGHLSRDAGRNPIERWCDRFAAAFLMPMDEATDEFGPRPDRPAASVSDARLATAAQLFRVSPQAMLIRLVHLGYVSADYYWRIKRPQFQKEEAAFQSFGRASVYASRYRSWNGDLYSRLVLEAWADGRVSDHSAAEYLGMTRPQYVEDLRRMFEAA